MKKSLFVLLFTFISITLIAQEKISLSDEFANVKTERESYWEKQQYENAIELMKDLCVKYQQADSREKGRNYFKYEALNYDIARGYSLIGQVDSAIAYLEKFYDLAYGKYSTYYRSLDYYYISKDADFDNLKENETFHEIMAKLKSVSWDTILKEYKNYKPLASKLKPFEYINDDGRYLPRLKEKYQLDSVAGSGNDVSQIINLMNWVHKTILYNGNSGEPVDRHADALIEYSKTESKGLNCWMLSTTLNEVYLSMGFKSRFVSCYPKGDPSITHEWHVIVEVFSPSLNKWLWMDPTTTAYVKDDKGNLLSIAEVRDRLTKGLYVTSSEMDVNGSPYPGGSDKYLHDYMMKNLFRIEIPLISIPAYEMAPRKIRYYVELLPDGYNPRNVKFHEPVGKYCNTIYTTDDKQFWAAPELN